jgi:predicted N-acetyltransferase YhbS
MIYYLVTKAHTYTMGTFLESPIVDSIRDRIKIIPYEEFEISKAGAGVHIFSDIERLSDRQRALFSGTFRELASRPGVARTMNDPGRVWRRFELLRNLGDKGMNTFTAHHLKDVLFSRDAEAIKFPVFLRRENDHGGPLSSLIYSRRGLIARGLGIGLRHRGIRDKIVTEFCDTSDAARVFRKYSAFRIGDVIVPRHLFFSDHWTIKEACLSSKAMIDEETAYVEQNPHRKELMNIFRMASIDYGRIDYGLKNGRVQVWEINTNPMLISSISHLVPERVRIHERFVERVLKTLKALDSEIVIRKMRADDKAGAMAVLSKWNMVPISASAENPDPERSSIDVENSFVAVHGERIVGIASYIMLSDTAAETASLAVDPYCKGDGLGYMLQAARLSEMHRRGVRLVRTETDRPETIKWYKAKFGYREMGRNKKKHDFSLFEVKEWTVLELDLEAYFSTESAEGPACVSE